LSDKDGEATDRRTGGIRRRDDREVCQFHKIMCAEKVDIKNRLKDGEKERKIFFTKQEGVQMWTEIGKKADWKVIVLFVAIMVGSLGIVWARLDKNTNMLMGITSKQMLIMHELDVDPNGQKK
jgi:hypothetical protein